MLLHVFMASSCPLSHTCVVTGTTYHYGNSTICALASCVLTFVFIRVPLDFSVTVAIDLCLLGLVFSPLS